MGYSRQLSNKMLKITVELIAFGDLNMKPKRLASMLISNDGTGTPELGNYLVTMSPADPDSETIETTVTGHPRFEDDAWHLLYRALKAGLEVKDEETL